MVFRSWYSAVYIPKTLPEWCTTSRCSWIAAPFPSCSWPLPIQNVQLTIVANFRFRINQISAGSLREVSCVWLSRVSQPTCEVGVPFYQTNNRIKKRKWKNSYYFFFFQDYHLVLKRGNGKRPFLVFPINTDDFVHCYLKLQEGSRRYMYICIYIYISSWIHFTFPRLRTSFPFFCTNSLSSRWFNHDLHDFFQALCFQPTTSMKDI